MNKKTIKFSLIILVISLCGFISTEWYTYESQNYRIMFPAKPVEESKLMKTLAGEIEVNTLIYKANNSTEKNLKFLLTRNQIPGTTIKGNSKKEENIYFDAAIKGSVRNHQAILLSEKSIKLNEYSGRAIKMSMLEGKIIVRMNCYVVGDIYYGLVVYTPKSNDDNPEIDHFFNSFHLKTN